MTPTADPHLRILHMALPDDWDAARQAGEYTISTRGVTLAEQGFIHCSYPHQVEAVANTFYADIERLVLLQINVDALGAEVIDEPPFAGSPDRFPHIYGPIDIDAVVSTVDWRRSPDAAWVLADELRTGEDGGA